MDNNRGIRGIKSGLKRPAMTPNKRQSIQYYRNKYNAVIHNIYGAVNQFDETVRDGSLRQGCSNAGQRFLLRPSRTRSETQRKQRELTDSAHTCHDFHVTMFLPFLFFSFFFFWLWFHKKPLRHCQRIGDEFPRSSCHYCDGHGVHNHGVSLPELP